MKEILIPAKTFKLYAEGKRTFIHVRNEPGVEEEFKQLKYGQKVILINQENTEETLEQVFSFYYVFEETKRFILLAFYWEKYDDLYKKRLHNVKMVLSASKNFIPVEIVSRTETRLYYQLQAYTSLFLVTDQFVNDLVALTKGKNRQSHWVVLDELKIRLKPDLEDSISVYSMFPYPLVYGD